MKKIFSIMLVFLLSFVLLTGCQDSPELIIEESLHEVVLYFSDNEALNIYKVKTDVVIETEKDLPKLALEAWIEGPEEEELVGLVPSNVNIEFAKEVDNVAFVSFSKEIQETGLGSTGETMLVEQLVMIMEQFGFKSTQILVEGEMGDSLFGHLYTADPFMAQDPENYKWIDEKKTQEIILENEAFKIFKPAPNSEVKDQIVVKGLARVFEATVQYEFEDGHYVFDKGFTTASEGAPGWGEFEIILDLDKVPNGPARVIIYEESAKDGSRLHELQIPITIKN